MLKERMLLAIILSKNAKKLHAIPYTIRHVPQMVSTIALTRKKTNIIQMIVPMMKCMMLDNHNR